MAHQSGKTIALDYYQKGGRASGILGILDNMIKEREEQKLSSSKITQQLLGVKEVQRGIAKQSGLPYEEDEATQLAKERTALLNKQTEQNISGTGPAYARKMAANLLSDLQQDTINLAMALRGGLSREKYVQQAKDQLLDLYDSLSPEAKIFFEQRVGQIYDNTASAFRIKVKPSSKKETSGKIGKYSYTVE